MWRFLHNIFLHTKRSSNSDKFEKSEMEAEFEVWALSMEDKIDPLSLE